MLEASRREVLLSMSAVAVVGASILWWRKRKSRSYEKVGVVSGLFVYPVKSCGGIPLAEAECLSTGIKHDRCWVLENADGQVVSARRYPTMVLVKPHFEHDYLCLDAPGMETIKVSLHLHIDTKDSKQISRLVFVPNIRKSHNKVQDRKRKTTDPRIWNSYAEGQFAGEDVSTWFSQYLNLPDCKFYQLSKPRFITDDTRWGNIGQPGDKTLSGPPHLNVLWTVEPVAPSTLSCCMSEMDAPLGLRKVFSMEFADGVSALKKKLAREFRLPIETTSSDGEGGRPIHNIKSLNPHFINSSMQDGTISHFNTNVAFADFAPYLFTTEASLSALNEELRYPVTMGRFRSNIVISGTGRPWVEDDWKGKSVKIGSLKFRVLKECGRCIFTTVSPATGEKDPEQEPLVTLKRIRLPEDRDKRYGDSPLFGLHCVVEKEGIVRMRDPVMVSS